VPDFLEKRTIRYPFFGLIGVTVVLIAILFLYNRILSIAGLLLMFFPIYFMIVIGIRQRKEMAEYITTLSYRVKRAGEEAIMEMPIGIMLFNEDFFIEWTNPYLASFFGAESLVGESLYDLADALIQLIKLEEDTDMITLKDRKFRVILKREERLLYFFDVTEQAEIEQLYHNERTVIATIFLDNYDELTQGMDDQMRGSVNNMVTSILNKWAQENGIFIKRVSSDRFIAVFNEEILQKLEKGKFSILDEIRELTSKQNVSFTLSIGIGTGVSSLPELGSLAQSSLDLALGRGGDQAAIKQPNGKVKFYGGKTNPIEKRTRVRARVISHAIRDLIMASDKVIVMGHKNPDMDSIGASIGIYKVAQMNDKDAYIVLNTQDFESGIGRLMEEVRKQDELFSHFVTSEAALSLVTDKSLLVIVDTHKPALVMEERLLNRIDNIVVIDHHRRGEEFIQNPILVYMEPYASSTSELVTEFLEYQPKRGKIEMIEATALLAGIIVDTKSFTLRTGARTFDAASYLRGHGADTILVQKFLKDDVNTFIKRAKLIESVSLYRDSVAIAKGSETDYNDQVIIAQAADTLLNMEGINASFVISRRSEGVIGISARSLGSINVQVIMESLQGGGHLTNAATQLTGLTIEETEQQLKQVINEYFEGVNKE
jgi:c-di-AMP phosphodiesterase-like protein